MDKLFYIPFFLFPSVLYALFVALILRIANIKGITFPIVSAWLTPYFFFLSAFPCAIVAHAFGFPFGAAVTILFSMQVAAVAAALPIHILTQSWWASVPPSLVVAVGISITLILGPNPSGVYGGGVILTSLAWHVATAGLLLLWAIRHRATSWEKGLCQSCGYDLTGLRDTRCPECGALFEQSNKTNEEAHQE